MKNFWPPRSKAKGFLIQSFARKYNERTSSLSTQKISNQFSANRIYEDINKDYDNTTISKLSIRKEHWANRDFSEYKQAA